MPTPYPTFRQLAAICRAQAAETRAQETVAVLLELARDYEDQAEAEEACRRTSRRSIMAQDFRETISAP